MTWQRVCKIISYKLVVFYKCSTTEDRLWDSPWTQSSLSLQHSYTETRSPNRRRSRALGSQPSFSCHLVCFLVRFVLFLCPYVALSLLPVPSDPASHHSWGGDGGIAAWLLSVVYQSDSHCLCDLYDLDLRLWQQAAPCVWPSGLRLLTSWLYLMSVTATICLDCLLHLKGFSLTHVRTTLIA